MRFVLMFLIPFDRTLKLLNFVLMSNFSIFASQGSELTLSQSGAQRQDIFHGFYIGN
jgi:hypothetical protein